MIQTVALALKSFLRFLLAVGSCHAACVQPTIPPCALRCLGAEGIRLLTESRETSGLAASRLHRGVVYTHNDSGDSPRFFAMGLDGSDQGTYKVTNATAVDWEDMARGPCASAEKSCLYIGDIGDNRKRRENYTVYRVEEPAQLAAGNYEVTAEAFAFEYPDGAHDAEALLVEPQTGRVYVITKDKSSAGIYRFPSPLDSGQSKTLEFLGQAMVPGQNPRVTAGDIHPNGQSVVLRTKANIFLYTIPKDSSVEAALAQSPCQLPMATEAQGEAIAWTQSGDGYVTSGEGANKELHLFTCGDSHP